MAIIAEVSEEDVEATPAALRRARAQAAISRMRATAQEHNLQDLPAEEIAAEIAAVRARRKDRDAG